MKAKITVAVEEYRPNYADGENRFVLQSPISPERRPGDRILVRQDRGEFNNHVTSRKPEELVKLDNGPKSAYAHGILLRSDPSNGHREGDQIWLTDLAIRRPADGISAVNLRTWEPINVALHDVCWIPKYHTLDRGEDDEELLTISGPTVRSDKRGYVLAVVQRLRSRDHIVKVESMELKDIVEQDLWKYQNLTALADGKTRIGMLFRRGLESVRPATFSYDDTDEESETRSIIDGLEAETASSRAVSLTPSALNISEGTSLGVSIDYSLNEGEDDPHVDPRRLELERKVMADLAKEPEPVLQSPPAAVCNLGHRCPTPPMIFCHANMPTLENQYPKHHHREDHQCRGGGTHKLHCIFQFRKDRKGKESVDKTSCIIPPTMRHTCCETNALPYKKFDRPPIIKVLGGAGVVKEGRDFSVVGELEDDYSDLPVEAAAMPYVPERDLDGLEASTSEYQKRAEKAEEAARWVNEFCNTGVCHGQLQQQQMQPIRSLGVPGPFSFAPVYSPWDVQAGLEPLGSASRPIVVDEDDDDEEDDEEHTPDVFGDRHFHDDDDMDLSG